MQRCAGDSIGAPTAVRRDRFPSTIAPEAKVSAIFPESCVQFAPSGAGQKDLFRADDLNPCNDLMSLHGQPRVRQTVRAGRASASSGDSSPSTTTYADRPSDRCPAPTSPRCLRGHGHKQPETDRSHDARCDRGGRGRAPGREAIELRLEEKVGVIERLRNAKEPQWCDGGHVKDPALNPICRAAGTPGSRVRLDKVRAPSARSGGTVRLGFKTAG